MVIGITGFVGSGKSMVTDIFATNFLCYVLKLDDLAKEMINNSYQYVNNNNFLNNADIEDIKKNFHPLVWNKAKSLIEIIKNENKYKFIVVETALPSNIFFELCDKTFCISNNILKKKEVLIKNRSYSENKIDTLINLQQEYQKYYDMCDYNIENNSTIEDLNNKILSIIKKELL